MRRLLLCLATVLLANPGWSYTYIYPGDDNTLLPIKWPPGDVSVTIMLGTNPTLSDGLNYNTSVQAAARSWNPFLGDIQLQTVLKAAGSPADHNGVNELGFASTIFGKAFGAGVLAVTTTWTDSQNVNQRAEADTLFNNKDWTWDSFRGPLASHPGVQDIQRVAIHELGHLLGLDHPDEAGQHVSAIMNSLISDIDAQTTDDTDGVRNLYGPAGAPANDNFANAATLQLAANNNANQTGFNTKATKETGEPDHADNAGGRSVWWKWTAPGDGSATLDTIGSYFDTTLGVYTGSSLTALHAVASNDDIDPGIIQASQLSFNTTSGTTYLVAIDGFDGDSAAYFLNLAFHPGENIPVFTAQPVSQTVNAGASVSFSVTVTSATTVTYQWYLGTTAISGATDATLTLANVQAADAGSYSVTASNSSGKAISASATLTVNSPPTITAQPASQTVTAGTNASFSVTATGDGTLTYQWSFGGAAISGAITSTLTVIDVQAANAGSYSVTVSNATGSVTSNTVTLTVNPAPAPITKPSSGGGGGGGAPSLWFVAALSVLGIGRLLRNRP